MVAFPAPTAVKTPELLTEPTRGLLDTHGFVVAAVGEPDKFDVPLRQRVVLPDTVGFALTVTTADAVHP
jgi:hypothetical protein